MNPCGVARDVAAPLPPLPRAGGKSRHTAYHLRLSTARLRGSSRDKLINSLFDGGNQSPFGKKYLLRHEIHFQSLHDLRRV
ncbi:unnamed protein product [Danaus chrysippus]|uniref:(African queen) hypothetical protein n=1 Tax=Danaus chrysippus TaxID=151541 RepID=A0A8J2M9B6_9NEOP|nr:unnamed protein product [Danaus chrysippus]